MEESRKLYITAFIIVLGGNASNISDAIHPADYRPDPFTGLDGAKLKAEVAGRMNNHIHKQQKELELMRHRISECEYKTQWSAK